MHHIEIPTQNQNKNGVIKKEHLLPLEMQEDSRGVNTGHPFFDEFPAPRLFRALLPRPQSNIFPNPHLPPFFQLFSVVLLRPLLYFQRNDGCHGRCSSSQQLRRHGTVRGLAARSQDRRHYNCNYRGRGHRSASHGGSAGHRGPGHRGPSRQGPGHRGLGH
jgi:hypothetical protein